MTKQVGKERKYPKKMKLTKKPNQPSSKNQTIRNILKENEPSPGNVEILNRTSRKQRSHPKKYDLTPQEFSLLQEIADSLSIFEDERHLPIIGFATVKSDAFNWISVYARRMVKFCKNMTAFKALQTCDQHKILKFAYLNILTIRLSFTLNTERQAFPVLAVNCLKNSYPMIIKTFLG